MKKLTLILAALTFVTVVTMGAVKAAHPVLPQPIFGTTLSTKEVEKYVDAAAKYSRYHKPWMARPVIDIVPVDKWQEQVCGGYDCGILGYTSDDERNIVHIVAVIPDAAVKKVGWTRDEIIVHEVVHWLQIHDGQPFPTDCAGRDAMETEAYNTQFQYAVHALHRQEHGFWKPDIFGGCLLEKLMNGRGHH